MGFMVDGCGVTTKAKPLKFIGNMYCEQCKKIHPFNLCEIRDKVAIVFIPTVTLNKRYAVLCEKCKTGFKIPEEVKEQALRNEIKFIKGDGCIEFVKAEPDRAESAQTENIVVDNGSLDTLLPKEDRKEDMYCPKCKQKLIPGMHYCINCGLRID